MCTHRTGFFVLAVTAATRAVRALGGAGLSGVALASAAAAGALVSRRQAYPRPRQDALPQRRPAAAAVPGDRIVVAVVLGARGSVGTDALAPYEVFARSPAFAVYTASAGRAVSVLSGGLVLAPDYSLEDVDAGSAPEPDVVVIPAVAGPAGKELAPLRDWITRRAGRGAHILGVCAGSVLLAETGLLDGRRATSHWSNITRLQRKHPQVEWVRGQRYVEDGPITTTAGVTSGVFGALRLVERLAGAAEAERLGAELAYPGWRPGTAVGMPVQRATPGDLSYALTMAFPWFRPTVGVGLVEGAGEIDVAAAFDIYAGNSFAARAVPIAAGATITTRHGLQLIAQPAGTGATGLGRFVVPGPRNAGEVDPGLAQWAASRGLGLELPHAGQADGEFSFDPLLRDLAAHAGKATARSTAKNIEYPMAHLRLAGSQWPWRPTALFALTIAAAVGAAFLPAAARRHRL
jgi:putative intracellular protease/amidase